MTTSSAWRPTTKCPMRSWPSSAADVSVPARQGTIRILGVDPGLRHTGWGIVDATDNRLQFIAEGVIDPDPTLALSERLRLLFEGVRDLIVTYQPIECAV